MKIAVCLCTVVMLGASLCAAPKTIVKNALAPVGTYASYAFSKNASSYDDKDPMYVKSGGSPAFVEKRGADYVLLDCSSSQTVLKAPFGWYSDEDGQNSRLYTPDERSRIIMGFRDINGQTFAQMKQTLLSDTRSQMKQMKQNAVVVRAFSLSGGSYAVEVTGIKTPGGNRNGFLQVFTPNPKKPRYPMSLSLTAPMGVYPKYRGLVGLILRDRKILWTA